MLRVSHCIHNRPQGGGEILPAASANIVIGSNDSLAHQCNGTVVQPFYDLILCLAVRHCIHGAGGKSGDKVKPACIGVQKGIGFRDIAVTHIHVTGLAHGFDDIVQGFICIHWPAWIICKAAE